MVYSLRNWGVDLPDIGEDTCSFFEMVAFVDVITAQSMRGCMGIPKYQRECKVFRYTENLYLLGQAVPIEALPLQGYGYREVSACLECREDESFRQSRQVLHALCFERLDKEPWP